MVESVWEQFSIEMVQFKWFIKKNLLANAEKKVMLVSKSLRVTQPRFLTLRYCLLSDSLIRLKTQCETLLILIQKEETLGLNWTVSVYYYQFDGKVYRILLNIMVNIFIHLSVMFTLTKCQIHIDELLLLSCWVVSDSLRHVIGALHVHFSCDTLNRP